MFVASLATIAIVPACNDQGTTAPQLRPPAAAHDGAALYQGFLGVAATNDVNNGTFGPVSSGISI
ncbi:MAG TPA: hypothetical protein VFY85_15060, partial [Gemmatimonadaceae bacterium]|nr:hypothetical protein [Gemmatimonadaceae bacterium]